MSHEQIFFHMISFLIVGTVVVIGWRIGVLWLLEKRERRLAREVLNITDREDRAKKTLFETGESLILDFLSVNHVFILIDDKRLYDILDRAVFREDISSNDARDTARRILSCAHGAREDLEVYADRILNTIIKQAQIHIAQVELDSGATFDDRSIHSFDKRFDDSVFQNRVRHALLDKYGHNLEDKISLIISIYILNHKSSGRDLFHYREMLDKMISKLADYHMNRYEKRALCYERKQEKTDRHIYQYRTI